MQSDNCQATPTASVTIAFFLARTSGNSKSAVQLSAAEGTVARFVSVADGRNRAVGFLAEPEMALCEANNEFDSAVHLQLVIKTLEMRVCGVRRNTQFLGNHSLLFIVKHALGNLKFTPGQRQPLGNVEPYVLAEETSTSLAIIALTNLLHLGRPHIKPKTRT